jgi:hypothetical protein
MNHFQDHWTLRKMESHPNTSEPSRISCSESTRHASITSPREDPEIGYITKLQIVNGCVLHCTYIAGSLRHWAYFSILLTDIPRTIRIIVRKYGDIAFMERRFEYAASCTIQTCSRMSRSTWVLATSAPRRRTFGDRHAYIKCLDAIVTEIQSRRTL